VSGKMSLKTRLILGNVVVLSLLVVAGVLEAVTGSQFWVELVLGAGAVAIVGCIVSTTRGVGDAARTLGVHLGLVAAGELPEPLDDHVGDDFDQVRAAVNKVVGTLGQIIAEMSRMSAEHEKGDLDAVMDEARFPGDYGVMVRGVNAMVGAHIAVKKKAMAVFSEFGKGNFDAKLEQLPGKKKFINDTIEQVRGNLKSLIAEMSRMSAEHEKGDIDVVIDEARFPGDYKAMARGVNAMVGAHIAVKKKAMAVFSEFGKGNFDAKLEQLPGKKKFINDTVEQVRANMRGLVGDARKLMEAAAEGKVYVRADAKPHAGEFRKVVEGMNAALDAVVAPVREVREALDKLAGGDLAARTDPSRYQNESRHLLEKTNATLSMLLAPVEDATRVLGQLAQRDLRARMGGSYSGGHAAMKDALNATAEALDQALSQVADAASQVSGASAQIAASSQAVASGASEQASALTETTSSVESVASIARQAADSAQQANGLAATARTAATQGVAAVEQMQAAMVKIKASAEGTSQIIKDINDIAFQTNLLALNAAVEAARAGEAGRGFAVVAEEVRSLALRAKEAATKTEELIRQSVGEAGQGEVASREVATKLGEIGAGIGKVSDIISEIAAAAREQASGVEQVTKAIAEMDKVTQQNAASAEESSSAASELNGQSEELASMVGAFRISRAGEEPAKAARKAPAAQLKPAPRDGSNGAARGGNPFPMDDETPLQGF
jgi:methyl-accepting chemotaxis protein